MCKHVYIAHFGIRFAQLVICMRLHTDRIQKVKSISTLSSDAILPALKKLRLSVYVILKCFLVK